MIRAEAPSAPRGARPGEPRHIWPCLCSHARAVSRDGGGGGDFGPEAACRFVEAFHGELLTTRRGQDNLGSKVELRSRIGRLKQVSKYLLAGAPSLRPLITTPSGDVSPEEFLARLQDALRAEWSEALARAVLSLACGTGHVRGRRGHTTHVT